MTVQRTTDERAVETKSPVVCTLALIFGISAVVVQLLGFLLALTTPYDSQGAVGKAFAAIFTELIAIPTALAGIILSITGRVVARRFDGRLKVALAASVIGLIPLAFVYVMIVA